MAISHTTQELGNKVQMCLYDQKSTTRNTDMKALVTAQKRDKLDFHLIIQYSIPQDQHI